MSKIVGIDLGTTNSLVSVRTGSETTVIVNAEGSRLTPSAVAFGDDGRIVGRAAKAQASVNPARTILSIKRFMGRCRKEVDAEEKSVPYKLVGAPDELVQVEVDGKRYYPPEVSAMILQDLKKSAEAYLGETVSKAIITCPAWYNSVQRESVKNAGVIAGLEVVRIINEPTAAALAYGLQTNKQQKIFVLDVGGGTTDNTVLDISDGVFEVLSTNGDSKLGGDDWDQAVLNHVASEFLVQTGIDVRLEPMALQRLRECSEKAKCDLSTMPTTMINIPYVTNFGGTPRHLQTQLTRAKFEEITEHLFERVRIPLLNALKDAKLNPQDIHEVVLVGGSTRMPRIQEMCRQIFGKDPNKSVNPDECVSVGAAIQGAILAGEDPTLKAIVLLDVTPLSLSVETLGGVSTIILPRNSTIPCTKSEGFSTATDSQPAVDIHVLQGERKMSADNRTLGRFTLTGIPPAPRGVPQIEVSFSLDANGILNVTAKDKNSGREQKVEIRGASGLEKDQITKMVSEAAAYAEDDKKRADLAESRNALSQKVYQSEKVFKEFSGKLTKPTVDAMQSTLTTCRTVEGSNDKDSIDKAVYNLGLISQKMDEELAQKKKDESNPPQQQTAPSGGIPPPPLPPQQPKPQAAPVNPIPPPPPIPGTKKPEEVAPGFQPMQ